MTVVVQLSLFARVSCRCFHVMTYLQAVQTALKRRSFCPDIKSQNNNSFPPQMLFCSLQHCHHCKCRAWPGKSFWQNSTYMSTETHRVHSVFWGDSLSRGRHCCIPHSSDSYNELSIVPLRGCWKPAPARLWTTMEFGECWPQQRWCVQYSFVTAVALCSICWWRVSGWVQEEKEWYLSACYHHIPPLQLTLGSRWGGMCVCVCVCVRVRALGGKGGCLGKWLS